MTIHYSLIEIFTSEQARVDRKPLSAFIMEMVRELKIGARCAVFKGTDAIYEDGEQATRNVLALSFNMPVKIEILLPTSAVDQVLPDISRQVADGLVAVRNLDVRAYRKPRQFLPRHLCVRDIMTRQPASVVESASVSDVARLLIGAVFRGVPVVDAKDRPLGMITQHDLIYRAGMGLRLGLLALLDVDAVLPAMRDKKAGDIMTAPAVSVQADKPVMDAVAMMLERKLKRMPVVEPGGGLVGMLSRLDLFQAATAAAPAWDALRDQNVDIADVRSVSDIMIREMQTVHPEAKLADVIRVIDTNRVQRVAVTDSGNRFLGMVFDSDLLAACIRNSAGSHAVFQEWRSFVKTFISEGRGRESGLHTITAADIMRSDLVTVYEDTLLEEAIRIMTEQQIKRLPVLDAAGHFKGMISREQLFRIGFS